MKKIINNLGIIIPIKNETKGIIENINLINFITKKKFIIYIVLDDKKDESLVKLKKLKNLKNLKIIFNKSPQKNVKSAIDFVIKNTQNKYYLITVIDEFFTIYNICEMFKLFKKRKLDLISGTRYSKNGCRYGGNFIGKIFSTIGNYCFRILTIGKVTDATTGFKMFKREIWIESNLKSKIGWSFSLELSCYIFLKNKKFDELPIISLDRPFGGKSTFKFMSWCKNYMKLLISFFFKRLFKF